MTLILLSKRNSVEIVSSSKFKICFASLFNTCLMIIILPNIQYRRWELCALCHFLFADLSLFLLMVFVFSLPTSSFVSNIGCEHGGRGVDRASDLLCEEKKNLNLKKKEQSHKDSSKLI